MDNFEYWNKMKRPPASALKPISGGRMNGKTDINPQWRYQAMTETFGPIGFGWTYAIDRQWTEKGADGDMMAFCNISVRVCVDGAWSQPVPGTGGSALIQSEKSGLRSNDEAFKMALTDALSVALKMFGVAADIYAGLWDGSKYKTEPDAQNHPQPQQPQRQEQRAEPKQEIKAPATGDGLHRFPIKAVYHGKSQDGTKDLLKVIIEGEYAFGGGKYGITCFHAPALYKGFAEWPVDTQYPPKPVASVAVIRDPSEGKKYAEIVEIVAAE